MEFDFNINHLLPEIISLIGRDTPLKIQDATRMQQQRNLQLMIDELGRKSARAQQLTGSITNLQKSQINGHHIYVLKDPSSNNGLGSVIGFIKVGKKRLFLLDRDGNHNEMNPLSVLDFYVHESQQRKGCGLHLFKHMLSHEGVKAIHLAVDRPSHKFISFLKKHFNLWSTIPQVNNFVIFEGFFKSRSDIIRSSTHNDRYGRNSKFRPLSRAVSDDVIKRNRQAQYSVMVLKDVRPISGCATKLNQGHDFYSNSNNRRRKWNADGTWQSANNRSAPVRPNLYSRFSHETERNGLPPLQPSRRYNRHGDDDIITNPYKDEPIVGNNRLHHENVIKPYQNDDIVSKLREKDYHKIEGENLAKKSVQNRQDQPHPPYHAAVQERGVVNHQPEPPTCNTNITDHSSENQIRKCEQTETRQRSMYNKPSDMISELRAKDEGTLPPALPGNLPPQFYSNRRWKQLRGITSSWNVLGVPSTTYWHHH